MFYRGTISLQGDNKINLTEYFVYPDCQIILINNLEYGFNEVEAFLNQYKC